MEKPCKNKISVLISVLIVLFPIFLLLFVYSFLIDLTYAGCIECGFMKRELDWLVRLLNCIGFKRSNALKLLQGSLGIAVTVIIFISNWGIDLLKHSERKVFGISWSELQDGKSHWQVGQFILMFAILVLIVPAIIFEFCATSYALLACSYVLIFYKYLVFAESYNKKVQREKVVDKLIAYIDGEEDRNDDKVTDFCSALEDVREGILRTESWNNAWQLFFEFLAKAEKFERAKYFRFSGYFFEIIFDVPSDMHIQKQLIFVKKYLSRIDMDKESANMVLWSLLCSVALHWDPEIMESFLGWFIDWPERSSQRVLRKLGALRQSEMQQQSAEILVMLEYWMHMQGTDVAVEFVKNIYAYGEKFLRDDSEEHITFLQTLDDLYDKKYPGDGQVVYTAAQELYRDVKYHLNNTIIMTKLKYEG